MENIGHSAEDTNNGTERNSVVVGSNPTQANFL